MHINATQKVALLNSSKHTQTQKTYAKIGQTRPDLVTFYNI